jgi:tetratricopeptide (TPR) repeat protein
VDGQQTYRVLNREIFLLIALAALAIGVFFFTRNMALRDQLLDARIATIWYEKGERQLSSNEVAKAIDSFRNATTNDPGKQAYALALANALIAGNHLSEAQQALLRLRESDPENAEINLSLARLSAKRDLIDDAVHYYRNALYGRWNGGQVDERRRQTRVELIRFLLDHKERTLALSELLILENNLPESAAWRIQVGKLFFEAGDLQHALKNYAIAARLDDHNVEALSGAGEAAFRLGDYPLAYQYLKASVALDQGSEQIRQLLALTELVLAEDPLVPHLTEQERQRRLLWGVQQALQRLESCLSDKERAAEFDPLRSDALALQSKLQGKDGLADSETVTMGVELIARIEKAAAVCGQPSLPDQALTLIGRERNGGQQ